jgi:hypothetical protein
VEEDDGREGGSGIIAWDYYYYMSFTTSRDVDVLRFKGER